MKYDFEECLCPCHEKHSKIKHNHKSCCSVCPYCEKHIEGHHFNEHVGRCEKIKKNKNIFNSHLKKN